MGKTINYIIYKEDKFYVSQCLNIDVSSFGESIDEAKENLMEAVSLYLEDDEDKLNFTPIREMYLGENFVEV